MSKREEFEEVCDSLPVKITNNEKAVAQYIWTTQQKKIDALEADNPQVECIECRGYGFIVSKIFKVREQDLIIKELQAQLAEANERIERMIEEER